MKRNSFILNLGLMLLVGIGIAVGATLWLGSYTRHGEEVTIPEIRGKSLDEVRALFKEVDLHYEVVDSIYDESARAGVVRELVPSSGSKVKPGRIVFLTTYAYAPRPLTLPYVENMSARQAIALLRGLGFESVSTKLVSGEYRDLCLGVTDSSGKPIPAGTALNKNTPLIALVTGAVLDSLTTKDFIDNTESIIVCDEPIYEEPITSEPEPDTPDTARKTPPETKPENWW